MYSSKVFVVFYIFIFFKLRVRIFYDSVRESFCQRHRVTTPSDDSSEESLKPERSSETFSGSDRMSVWCRAAAASSSLTTDITTFIVW